MEEDDLTKKILDGLRDEYKELVRAVQARDTQITFDELHEKLLNYEAALPGTKFKPAHFLASANPAHRSNNGWRPSNLSNNRTNNTGWRPLPNYTNNTPAYNIGPNSSRNTRPPRPYLGHCQICGIQGHTTKKCPSYRLVPNTPSTTTSVPTTNSPTPWQPRAHFATTTSSNNPTWLLDTGASHHVTADLSNLSLHAPYTGSDDIMIGDVTGLPITHMGSISLHTPNTSFQLNNVLCVHTMKKNLISISQFCLSNNVSIEFSSSSFIVKDLRTGTTLLKGKTKDGVYEWPSSTSIHSSLLAFSNVKTTSSQ